MPKSQFLKTAKITFDLAFEKGAVPNPCTFYPTAF
jgi:hypothetical protein